jgi:lipopolysaccharide transport system permease protein
MAPSARKAAWRGARLPLLWEFVKREVAQQYKGSRLGLAWAVLNPLFMLLIYTVVFSAFLGFRSRGQSGGIGYALMIFSGLVPFRVVAEAIGRAPTAITGNADLVKRVVFPSEILPVSVALGSFVNGLFALAVLLVMVLAVEGALPLTLAYLPAVWVVEVLLTTAVCYFLAAAGALVRDIQALVPHLTMALLFLTPVVYPLESLPARFQRLMVLNPVAVIVVSHRNVVLYGEQPLWLPLGVVAVLSAGLALAGARLFQVQSRYFPEEL